MDLLAIDFLETIYNKEKETSLLGKWIRFKDIKNLFKNMKMLFRYLS